MVLTCELKRYCVVQMKVFEQNFTVHYSILLYKMVLTLQFVDNNLVCNYSNSFLRAKYYQRTENITKRVPCTLQLMMSGYSYGNYLEGNLISK